MPTIGMEHDHEFVAQPPGTLIVDRFEFESPFGFLGWMVDRVFLCGYMRRFFMWRNQALKKMAESADWKFWGKISYHVFHGSHGWETLC